MTIYFQMQNNMENAYEKEVKEMCTTTVQQ
jgi:hypothetical protein